MSAINRREAFKAIKPLVHIIWKHREPSKLNLHYCFSVEARKSIVEMAQLNSVLRRVWWFIHPEAHNFIILSLQNVIMNHMCVYVSQKTPAHRWALWTAAHFSLPLNFHNSLPLNGDTYWRWHMLSTVFSNRVHNSVNTERGSWSLSHRFL